MVSHKQMLHFEGFHAMFGAQAKAWEITGFVCVQALESSPTTIAFNPARPYMLVGCQDGSLWSFKP